MNSSPTTLITIAYGDGIGPEVTEATLTVLREAGANLTIETIEIGSRIYSMGSMTGILPGAWDALTRSSILLKGPVQVPEGSGETGMVIRKKLGLDGLEPEYFDDNGMATAVAYRHDSFVLFEPIYTEEQLAAGKGAADPSPMLHAAILMLEHVGQHDTATLIRNAWQLATQDGCHLKKRNLTRRLTDAVVERLGKAQPRLAATASQ